MAREHWQQHQATREQHLHADSSIRLPDSGTQWQRKDTGYRSWVSLWLSEGVIISSCHPITSWVARRHSEGSARRLRIQVSREPDMATTYWPSPLISNQF